MAVKSFNPFPLGFRLISGTALNALFQGQQQMQSINVSNGVTIAGGMTSTGGQTVSGPMRRPITPVTAIGASRASATPIPASAINVWVTTSTSAQGLALSALTSGQEMWVWPMPTIGVKLFTHAGQVLNALASATGLQLASAKPIKLLCGDGVHIRTMPVAA